VREIQSKITRYGVSTGQIANDMAKIAVLGFHRFRVRVLGDPGER
jgi:hypothetical protein